MLPRFDEERLHSELRRLGYQKQLAFGVLCSERLLPNYEAFNAETGHGDISVLRNAVELLWDNVLHAGMEIALLQSTNAACEAQAPSSNAFESLFITAAQDACFSLCALMDFVESADLDRVVVAARYAIESIDLYVQEIERMNPGDSQLEEKILSHPLMQDELLRQQNCLEELKQFDIINSKTIGVLRSRFAVRVLPQPKNWSNRDGGS